MQHNHRVSLVKLSLRLGIVLATLVVVSCGDTRNIPKVYPVMGKIQVNGQPAAECQIVLNWVKEEKRPATPQGLTNENGEFQLTSFVGNDGAPEGEYVVTIEWRERSGITKQDFDGPDRLGGAYAKVERTKSLPGFAVRVERQSLQLPTFELQQTAEAKRKLEASKKKTSFGGPLGASDK